MNKITKAIIPVAGWGTRRLPITKTIEKSMLPIGNRPLIDYIVQDCIKAGITDIYFVVSEGSTQIQDYYRPNQKLNEYLEKNGKLDRLPTILPSEKEVNLHFVEQNPNDKYGTAIPVALVGNEINEDESVLVLMGDDFTYQEGVNDIANMIKQAGGDSILLGIEVPKQDVSKYGVIDLDHNHNFKQIIEKPSPEQAPSNLINISKYVLNSKAIAQIKQYADRDDIVGEYYITVPLNDYVKNGGKMKVIKAEGEYLDGGSVEGWLHANNVILAKK